MSAFPGGQTPLPTSMGGHGRICPPWIRHWEEMYWNSESRGNFKHLSQWLKKSSETLAHENLKFLLGKGEIGKIIHEAWKFFWNRQEISETGRKCIIASEGTDAPGQIHYGWPLALVIHLHLRDQMYSAADSTRVGLQPLEAIILYSAQDQHLKQTFCQKADDNR